MGEAMTLPVRTVEGPDGRRVPFHVVPFDKNGSCVAPVSRDLLARAALDATDVFVFSHGWNTDFETAARHYDGFIQAFATLRRRVWATPDRAYRPLLAGVFWPSAALTSSPTDAGEGRPDRDRAMLAELAAGFTRAERGAARELADRPSLDLAEARRLAALLSSLVRSEDDEPHEGPELAPDPDVLVEAARAQPDALRIDPRALIRLTTMLLMKDRAATVGAHGVADLLLRLQATPERNLPDGRRVHLVGHSYGAKVMLAALSSPGAAGLMVDSVLLLQPAVSAECFAPGAYGAALGRTRQPLVTTFSEHDTLLNQLPGDLAAQHRFAALGGVGPVGIDHTVTYPVEPPTPYDFPANAPNHLVAVDARDLVRDHDDVQSEATAWMLLSQVQS